MPASAQLSRFALRFRGTGVGPPGQQDRVRIPIDDNQDSRDASAPCDVGAGSFTIEFWVRGFVSDNNTPHGGGDRETADLSWINGNIIVDRDIYGGSDRDWGISIAGGFVRFGTGRGDSPSTDADNTIEGNQTVLDGGWHHVAITRDIQTGIKRIYVNGLLDFQSTPGISFADLSYPDEGVPDQQTPWGPFLVLGAEKHDAGEAYPSFNGWMDELRIWNVALTQSQLLTYHDRVTDPNSPGMVGYYRFEEGSGTSVADTSAADSPTGELIAGIPGNGEWAAQANDPLYTAPLSDSYLPAGFTRTFLSLDVDQPTVLEFAPDGRLFLGERTGRIRIWQGNAFLPDPVIQLRVDGVEGERGLLGMTVDPGFSSNGFLYVYLTPMGNQPRNRVSRFTVVNNSASMASEFVVWENPEPSELYHQGGAIAFGNDGLLYIATGDQFLSEPAQSLQSQNGKILRIRSDGSVPSNNPFVGVPGAEPLIWAYGLRNPWRMSFDSLTGRLFIGDVGGNRDESWEEINLGMPGLNYGWPYQEAADCLEGDCTAYTTPIFSYQHTDPTYLYGPIQASITMGPFYRHTAFPPSYRNCLYFADYANLWIRRLVLDVNGTPVADVPFMSQGRAGTVVDLKVGPDGALYYITYDYAGDEEVIFPGLYRVSYSNATNAPPTVIATASPMNGLPPLMVQFEGSQSFDPEGDVLSFEWDFGDGQVANEPNPTHTYDSAGSYTARLFVRDATHESISSPILIRVGSPPEPAILEPLPDSPYRAGDSINFSGRAVDSEDGELESSQLSWVVLFHHTDHVHPFLGPIDGISSGSFSIPSTGHGPEHTYYEIRLTATDSDGLKTTISINLTPVPALLLLETLPSGIALKLDEEPFNTPGTYESLDGFIHSLEAAPMVSVLGTQFVFRCWNDGVTNPIRTLAATASSNRLLRAGYAPSSMITLTAAVSVATRNAEYHPDYNVTLANVFDPNGLCAGRDNNGPYQCAMEFALKIPRHARVLAAQLRLRATSDQNGNPTLGIFAYNVSNAAPFTAGVTLPLTQHHPVLPVGIAWSPPAFVAQTTYGSPNLASLLHPILNRQDWVSGNYFGLVVDGSPSPFGWRCWNNAQSGSPPTLAVSYSLTEAPINDIDNDGIPDDWEVQHGLDCTDSEDASSDVDNDGATALEEYVGDTNPNDSTSRLTLGIRLVPHPELFWMSSTGRFYRALLAPAPDGAWSPLAPAAQGTGGLISLPDPNPPSPRFYRIEVSLP